MRIKEPWKLKQRIMFSLAHSISIYWNSLSFQKLNFQSEHVLGIDWLIQFSFSFSSSTNILEIFQDTVRVSGVKVFRYMKLISFIMLSDWSY